MIGSLLGTLLMGVLAIHDNEDQKRLDQIAVGCGLSAGDLTIETAKPVNIRPKGTPTYEAVMCALPKLREAGFVTKIGFVSEPPAEETN